MAAFLLESKEGFVSSLAPLSVCADLRLDNVHNLLVTKGSSILSCQRPINEAWAKELARSYLRDFINNKFIVIPSVFQIAQKDGKMQLIDGQHRYAAYKYCLLLYSDPVQRLSWFRTLLGDESCLHIGVEGFIDEFIKTLKETYVTIKTYTIIDESHGKFLFDRINKQLPVERVVTSSGDIIRSAINKIRSTFPKSDTIAISRTCTKIDYGKLEIKLRESKIVEMHDLKSADRLYAIIIKVNEFFLRFPLDREELFYTFPSGSKRTSTYLKHSVMCRSAGLMLGLYPNYEWVDELSGKGSYYIMHSFHNNYEELKAHFLT